MCVHSVAPNIYTALNLNSLHQGLICRTCSQTAPTKGCVQILEDKLYQYSFFPFKHYKHISIICTAAVTEWNVMKPRRGTYVGLISSLVSSG